MDIEINKSPEALPAHIGIIMDGNGRWAKQRGQIRTAGHEEGLKRAKEIAKAASDLGIKYVTLYAFSTENWKRAKSEVGFLMNLIHTHLLKELKFYKENSIRVRLLGDITGLPAIIQKDILETEKDTKDFTGLTICLAINYGGRDEIVRSIKKMIKEGIPEQEITEGTVSSHFDFPELPDVDLLIRTGGEQRISNFLIWQASYAEFLFTKTLWPDYNKEEFYNNIAEFQKRTRRFGAVPV
ncbi:MAG: di-trans,poly-cis-decaprenylcistransferase [Treponema sp.]|nr:di-trans,poly-cis-decaprenylcistransferase [Treponema sp.]MBQ2354416.1 di-trans,poly-cis-decaprenylcistransferase [Treponema sp.]